MRWLTLILSLLSLSSQAQDECVVFSSGESAYAKFMGLQSRSIQWEEIDYVYHIYYTDSFPDSYISEDIIMDAHEHLNEEFEEAMISFDLVSIAYHDFDEFWAAPAILASNNICVPYSSSGWNWMESYVEDLIWDREAYMNVHIFPQFCSDILGFAWTAYNSTDLNGVWVRSDMMGRYGPQLTDSARMENKTLIHEVGHFVGLHHVFRNVDNCGQVLGDCLETGDYVCDTPPTKINWSCVNPICPPGAYDYTPNNHMDYYVDSCRTNFTEGQIERIHAALPILRPGITDQPPYCVGDINGDHVVGMMDLMLMLTNWEDAYWIDGDLNGNGYFNVIDFQILLAHWGMICYGAELDPFYREQEAPTIKSEGRHW
jgi:hypothetical protein